MDGKVLNKTLSEGTVAGGTSKRETSRSTETGKYRVFVGEKLQVLTCVLTYFSKPTLMTNRNNFFNKAILVIAY